MVEYNLEEEIGRQISEGIDIARQNGVICGNPGFFVIERNINGKVIRKAHIIEAAKLNILNY